MCYNHDHNNKLCLLDFSVTFLFITSTTKSDFYQNTPFVQVDLLDNLRKVMENLKTSWHGSFELRITLEMIIKKQQGQTQQNYNHGQNILEKL